MPRIFENIVRSYREGTNSAAIVASLRSYPDYMNHIHEDFGFTILHAAASRSDIVLARGIFSRPSVVNIINNTSHSGKTAASIFAERGMLEFVEMSVISGADLLLRGGESHSAIYHLFANEESREYALNYLRQDQARIDSFRTELEGNEILLQEFEDVIDPDATVIADDFSVSGDDFDNISVSGDLEELDSSV